MEQRAKVGNLLLAALPPADLEFLVPHFRTVRLERDAVLVRSGDVIERIHFPLSGLIAFIMDMPDGQTVATSVVGKEGAVGLLSTLGPARFPMTAVVRVAGRALEISPARFQTALGRCSALSGAVQTHTRALMAQFQHVAACNALHSVEARLARWLLHVHDRVEGDVLPLTHDTLSEFLGVRRTTVTQVISRLRQQGAIKSNRRSWIEIDRPRLEAASCECYHLMRRRIDRIVLSDQIEPAGRTRPVDNRPAQAPLFAEPDETHQRPPGTTGPRARPH
jgi:CRP-like cAMP-binding protein